MDRKLLVFVLWSIANLVVIAIGMLGLIILYGGKIDLEYVLRGMVVIGFVSSIIMAVIVVVYRDAC